MNKIKNLITVILLIISLASLNVCAAGALGENETPFLPIVTDSKKDEASDNEQTDNSTTTSTGTATSSGGGGSYIPVSYTHLTLPTMAVV